VVERAGPTHRLTYRKRKEVFFLKKKKQKTFSLLVDAAGTSRRARGEQKFFGSFFQKRTAFFAFNAVGITHGV
jgi:hypothetical protein